MDGLNDIRESVHDCSSCVSLQRGNVAAKRGDHVVSKTLKG
jgi:hypothetical protein